jgi:hypothetical protein
LKRVEEIESAPPQSPKRWLVHEGGR